MSKETKLPIELTAEELTGYEEKCREIEAELKVSKVHCCVQLKQDGTNERIVSFIQDPNYTTKLALMDKASIVGSMMAAEELRLMCQVKEHSNSLTYGDASECDFYKLGVARFCMDIIVYATNQFKKK
jgi:hypothetical protein